MKDIRGKDVQDGNLVLKIQDIHGGANYLKYSVVLNTGLYYKRHGLLTASHKFSNDQIVKIENLTSDELDIKKQLLKDIIQSKGKGIASAKTICLAEKELTLIENIMCAES